MAKMSSVDGLAEQNRRAAFREWNRQRVANIHANVSAADVLTRHGISLRRSGTQSEAMSCPFHGDDRHPSAKYFPEEGESRSSVWCFVCHERWDAFALWKKFTGTEKFPDVLRGLERAFGLTPPEANMISEDEAPYDPLVDEVRQLFEVAEQRLREYRDCFALESHLKLGQILDHTAYYLEHNHISLADAKKRLTAVHARIKKSRTPRAKAPADP